MNTRTLIFASILLTCSYADAGRRCSPQPTCCGTESYSYASGPTTKWFKAKDGTIREVMTHWEALHRAVEADHLETDLAGVRGELETATAELAALKEKAAADIAALENQLATLKQQLGEQTKLVSIEKQRADAAEAAQKAAAKEIADLKAVGEEAKQVLAKVQKDMQQTAADRDALKTANDKLQQDVAAAAAAKAAADDAAKKAQAELDKMKQDALAAKKTEVAANEKKDEEPAEPKSDAPAKEEAPKKEDAPKVEE